MGAGILVNEKDFFKKKWWQRYCEQAISFLVCQFRELYTCLVWFWLRGCSREEKDSPGVVARTERDWDLLFEDVRWVSFEAPPEVELSGREEPSVLLCHWQAEWPWTSHLSFLHKWKFVAQWSLRFLLALGPKDSTVVIQLDPHGKGPGFTSGTSPCRPGVLFVPVT